MVTTDTAKMMDTNTKTFDYDDNKPQVTLSVRVDRKLADEMAEEAKKLRVSKSDVARWRLYTGKSIAAA